MTEPVIDAFFKSHPLLASLALLLYLGGGSLLFAGIFAYFKRRTLRKWGKIYGFDPN